MLLLVRRSCAPAASLPSRHRGVSGCGSPAEDLNGALVRRPGRLRGGDVGGDGAPGSWQHRQPTNSIPLLPATLIFANPNHRRIGAIWPNDGFWGVKRSLDDRFPAETGGVWQHAELDGDKRQQGKERRASLRALWSNKAIRLWLPSFSPYSTVHACPQVLGVRSLLPAMGCWVVSTGSQLELVSSWP